MRTAGKVPPEMHRRVVAIQGTLLAVGDPLTAAVFGSEMPPHQRMNIFGTAALGVGISAIAHAHLGALDDGHVASEFLDRCVVDLAVRLGELLDEHAAKLAARN